MQAAPGVGRVYRRLLVAHVHDLDALVEAAVVDRHHVAATQGEDALHTRLLERERRQFSAVYRCHGSSAADAVWA